MYIYLYVYKCMFISILIYIYTSVDVQMYRYIGRYIVTYERKAKCITPQPDTKTGYDFRVYRMTSRLTSSISQRYHIIIE